MSGSMAANKVTEEGIRKRDLFLERLRTFYTEISEWVEETNLSLEETSYELNERGLGEYGAPGLLARDEQGEQIFKVKPVGALIIAADARVDIVGSYDVENLFYLEGTGPTIIVTTGRGGASIPRERPMFMGVEHSGWYWIPEMKRGWAHVVDREIFYDLIRAVSDYDCRISAD